MGLGGVSFWVIGAFLVVAGVFFILVMAALVKYVFGPGKGSRNPN
jgi:hypothetical protein